ncbi:MAG: flippase-like domain-containing protein [Firmicutes bacterium]|nr:flippase-like domain-containing protein [Bacillota bacterium]
MANENKSPKEKRKSLLIYFLKLAFSFLLLYLLFRHINTAKLLAVLKSAEPVWLCASFTAFFVAVWSSAAAWKVLLEPLGLHISWTHVMILRLISLFFNQALPTGMAGDLWRAYIFGAREDKMGASFASVLAEKWVSYLSLSFCALIALLMGWDSFSKSKLSVPLAWFVGGMLAVAIGSILLMPWFIANGKKFFSRFGIANPWLEGMESFHIYRSYKKHLFYAFLLSCISPFAGGLAFWFISLSIKSSAPLQSFFILVPLTRVVAYLPVVVSSIGTQDITTVLFYAKYGIAKEVSFSISLIGHALKMLVGATGGLCYLFVNPSRKDEKKKETKDSSELPGYQPES